MNNYRENLSYGATATIFARANALKRIMTKAEKALWEQLRNRKLGGHKFRRQHPLAQFIADFYCHEAKLVVEADGGIHNEIEIKERDEERTYMIEKLGLKVIRFTNEAILNNIESVLQEIKMNLPNLPPSPPGEGPGMR